MFDKKTTITIMESTKRRLLSLAGVSPEETRETRDDIVNKILDEVEQSRGGETCGN